MLTQQEISDLLLRANSVHSDIVTAALEKEHNGCTDACEWPEALCLSNTIQALTFRYRIGDYTSDTTLALYNKLNAAIGLKNLDGVTVDPNAQPPSGITIDVTSGFEPLTIGKTQADLINGGDADNPNWYLPFLDNNDQPINSSIEPAIVKVNGVTAFYTFDDTFSPPRIYGFTSNDAQTITIKAI